MSNGEEELNFSTQVLMRSGWKVVEKNRAYDLIRPDGRLVLAISSVEPSDQVIKRLWKKAPDVTTNLSMAMELPHEYLTIEILENRNRSFDVYLKNFFGMVEEHGQCDGANDVALAICKMWWAWMERTVGPWNQL